MKKLKLLKIINTLLVIALVMTLLLIMWLNGVEFLKGYWYIFVVGFYVIMLMIKYFLLGGDNVLWFAICLTLLTGYMVLYNVGVIDIRTYPTLLIIVSITSFIVFLVYKNTLHMSLFLLFLFIGMPLFLLSFGIVDVWYWIFFEVVSIVISIIILRCIYYNLKG